MKDSVSLLCDICLLIHGGADNEFRRPNLKESVKKKEKRTKMMILFYSQSIKFKQNIFGFSNRCKAMLNIT